MPRSYVKRGKRWFSDKHGVALQRKFGKHLYTAETSARTKSYAKETAKGLRDRGYLVRIVKAAKSGHYVLYSYFVGRKRRRK